MPENQGKIIGGQYRLLSVLGEGAMGIVYRAEEFDIEGYRLRDVALKMMQPKLSHKPSFRQRFLREVRAATKLQSDYIVRVYASGQDEDGRLYFVMELIQGETLEDALRQGAMKVERAVSIARDICEALSEAHSLQPHPLIHRDLKPANIFLEKRNGKERAKVGDFGIARELEEGVVAQTITGTPGSMAPEQWLGRGDHRVDLYALGVILQRMLTGEFPPAPDPKSIPEASSSLVAKLLAYSPEDRPADAKSILQELDRLISGQEQAPPRNDYYEPLMEQPSPIETAAEGFSSSADRYTRLHKLLEAHQWKAADLETMTIIFEICDRKTERWLRHNDIKQIPCEDLRELDTLWRTHSGERFGFSIQQKIWADVGGRPGEFNDIIFRRFSNRVGWHNKKTGAWLRTYNDFRFVSDAPSGHLPSFIQPGVAPKDWLSAWQDNFKGFLRRLEDCLRADQ